MEARQPTRGYPSDLTHSRRMRGLGIRLTAEQFEALHEHEHSCPVCSWVHDGPACAPLRCALCPMGHEEPHQGPVVPASVRWPQTFSPKEA